MKKEEKEKILDMLQDISYAHEEGEDEFWQKWSEMHKYISEQKTEETDDGILVTDICWDTDEEYAELPGSVTVPRGTDIDRIADYLSDTYSFCVYSFRVVESHKMHIQTPAGAIEAKVLPDDEYPGIALLYEGEGSGEPGAIMEYTQTGENAGHVQLRIYSKENPDDDPWKILQMS